MVDEKEVFFLVQFVERWKTPSCERNISDYDIIQYTQIVTGKCVCPQVTVKQSTVFFMSDSLNTFRPNWEIQMDWENNV